MGKANIPKLINMLKNAKTYDERASLDITSLGIIEKKQSFNYISWTYADVILRTLDKDSAWEPFETPFPNMIGIKVVFEGKEYKSFMPILDNANQGAVVDADEGLIFWQAKTRNAAEGRKSRVSAMDMNNTIMRGFAKEVSKITGVGIAIYAGEDLSQYDQVKEAIDPVSQEEINGAIQMHSQNKEKSIELLKGLIKKRPAIANGAKGAEEFIKNLTKSEIKEYVGGM